MAKSNCPYCGNNPVPHFIFWYNESFNILLTPLRQVLLYNPPARFFKKSLIGQRLLLGTINFFIWLGIISRQNSLADCKVDRAKVLWEEAQKRGIVMQELLLFGKPFDTYSAERENKKIIFSGLPRPAGYSNKWLDLMDDKWLFKQLMQKNNLPVPAGGTAVNFTQALKIFEQIKKPIIVKPRSGSRGRHSTTFVGSLADLKKAFYIAKKLCYWVMVEEQLSGPVFRATVINFKLEGVLRGDPPQVVGDGIKTIQKLILSKNKFPHPGVKDIVLDKTAERFLSRQSFSFQSVPEKGLWVSLSEKIGVNYGGSSAEEFEICHPENKQLFERAAKILGDPLVGFDFIIPDIAKSWKEQKCGFIEVNSLPFINLHHNPLLGKPRNVAAAVWDMAGYY